MSGQRRWGTVPTAVALALSLVACSGTGSGEDSTSAALEESPVNQLFADVSALASLGEDESARAQAEQARAIEERVATCMADQGFDYQPAIPTSTPAPESESAEKLSDLEYAKQYGYGITTWDQATDSEPQPEDPNAAAYEAMSEAERAAWDRALWGEAAVASEGSEEIAVPEGGCYPQAQALIAEADGESPEVAAVFETPQNAELMARLAQVYENLDSDPGMAAVNQAWAECMSAAGYRYRAPEEAMDDILGARTEGGTSDDATATSDLEALKEREIATATADATCQGEVDYQNRKRTIQYAAEQAFIDENRPQIDALIAALNEVSP